MPAQPDPAAELAALRAAIREAHEAEQAIRRALKDAHDTANGSLKQLIRKTMLDANEEIHEHAMGLQKQLSAAMDDLRARWDERDSRDVAELKKAVAAVKLITDDLRAGRIRVPAEDLPAAFRNGRQIPAKVVFLPPGPR